MIYKTYKCRRKTNLTVEDLIEQIAAPIVERANKENIWYKFAYDEICSHIIGIYDFSDPGEFYVKLWDYFYKHNIQYHNKWAYVNNDKLL